MIRTRKSGGISLAQVVVQDYTVALAPTGDPRLHLGPAGAQGELRTISDQSIPRFKERQSEGQVFMNPVTMTRTRISSRPVNWFFGPHEGWGARAVVGDTVAEFLPNWNRPSWFESRVADAKSRTMISAYSRMRESEAQGLVSVAEFAKTVRMLKDPFNHAQTLLKKIVRARKTWQQRGKSLVDAAAAAWLEYRLGWKPLLYELQGIGEAYTKVYNASKPARAVARGGEEITYKGEELHTIVPSGVCLMQIRRNSVHKTKVSSGVLYEVFETKNEQLNRMLGLDLGAVPAALWEIVPFSFVVDRFLSVGSWLEAAIPRPGLRVLGNWTTTVDGQIDDYTCIDAYTGFDLDHLTHQSGGSCTVERRNMDRVCNLDFPLPPIPMSNPRDVTFNQTVDHLALLMQAFSGVGFTRK